MSSIAERIKEVRKQNGLTQQKFADRIGAKQNTIAQYEIGRNAPIDPVIASICREFNINESWLRTGEGEMLKPVNRDAEIAAFMGDIMRGEDADFRRRLIAVLSRLDVSEWELLEKMALKLAEETKKEDQAEA